jgi:phosphoglycolate phosphatase-like HAD superfamily hydrolase
MHLVVFDIDGTLLRSNEADETCFRTAVAEEFSLKGVSTDWGSYQYSTDSGILHELLERARGRGPSAEEIQSFQTRFVDHLKKFYLARDGAPATVPGARDVIARLQASPEFRVAIATGGWKRSAHFKLGSAGIHTDQIPSSYADDHFAREEIIRFAVDRAKAHYQVERFLSTTYLGDGRWDFWATQKLNIPFIGVTDIRGVEYLSREGVSHLIEDYSDWNSVLKTLNSAISAERAQAAARS